MCHSREDFVKIVTQIDETYALYDVWNYIKLNPLKVFFPSGVEL